MRFRKGPAKVFKNTPSKVGPGKMALKKPKAHKVRDK